MNAEELKELNELDYSQKLHSELLEGNLVNVRNIINSSIEKDYKTDDEFMTFEIKQDNNAIFYGFPSLDNISLSKKSFIDFIMEETEKLKEKMQDINDSFDKIKIIKE